MMRVEHCRHTSPLPDLVKIFCAVKVSLIIILKRDARFDRIRKELKILAPPIHCCVLFAESAAHVNVDLCPARLRKTHCIHDISMNLQVSYAIPDNMLSRRCKRIKVSRVEGETLIADGSKRCRATIICLDL